MPNVKSRDVVTGLIVLIILVVGVVWIFRYKNKANLVVPQQTPSVTQKIQDKFNGFIIPEGINKVELKDVSGGDAMGIATETEVLADLPDLSKGEFYQVWASTDGKLLSLGKMRIAKGGYIFEGNVKDKKIVVSREKIFDNKIEVKILE